MYYIGHVGIVFLNVSVIYLRNYLGLCFVHGVIVFEYMFLWQAFHANNHYLRISEIHLRISVNNFGYPKFIFQYPKIRWILWKAVLAEKHYLACMLNEFTCMLNELWCILIHLACIIIHKACMLNRAFLQERLSIEFRTPVNEFWISINEFRISVNELRISKIQLNFGYPSIVIICMECLPYVPVFSLSDFVALGEG